jgi:hypothetical protein
MTVHEVTRVDLIGVEEMCWRCRRPTVALIGVRPHDGRRAGSLESCQDEKVLAYAAAALPAEAAARMGVGPVKPRFSRTRNGEYLSNGCVHCDALLGDFYLYHETLPEVLALEGFAGLVTIATVDVGTAH